MMAEMESPPLFFANAEKRIDKNTNSTYNSNIPHGGILEGIMNTHENTKAVLNRLSRAIGHMNAIKKMVEDGRDCSEVLIQLSAVKSEIIGVSKVILVDHIDHCIVDAVRENDKTSIDALKGAIEKLI